MVCKHKLDSILADEKDNNELLELKNALEITYNDYKSKKISIIVTTTIVTCLLLIVLVAVCVFVPWEVLVGFLIVIGFIVFKFRHR